MSDRDLKILNDRKSTLLSKITWHKGKLAELEGELEGINSFINSSKQIKDMYYYDYYYSG